MKTGKTKRASERFAAADYEPGFKPVTAAEARAISARVAERFGRCVSPWRRRVK